eukprot:TRINITY_DN8790_c0_g1_i1.p1 TRINITY_DN8790_c0_g1~~TRINITY_DN8790_c0_g1_i1.p1  ORF type:complete len:182 (+),score=29.98 TRINITY_DN8790_c0_g1_i1:33-578(+)
MDVFTRLEDGSVICVTVRVDSSVADLKKEISKAIGFRPCAVQLVYNGEAIAGNAPLADVCILPGDEVSAVVDKEQGSIDVLREWGVAITPQSLVEAASEGKLRVVELLLDTNRLTTSTFHKLYTPLHSASRYGRLDVVNLLLSRGGDPLQKDGYGWTSILLAKVNKHDKVVEALEEAVRCS